MKWSYQSQSLHYTSIHSSDPYPANCICKGSGWWLSNYDTWQQCSYTAHRKGNERHPEDVAYEESMNEWAAEWEAEKAMEAEQNKGGE